MTEAAAPIALPLGHRSDCAAATGLLLDTAAAGFRNDIQAANALAARMTGRVLAARVPRGDRFRMAVAELGKRLDDPVRDRRDAAPTGSGRPIAGVLT